MAIAGIAIFVFVIGYILSSLRQLGPSELGAVDFFGREWYERGPGGLIFVPLGLAHLTIFSTRGNQAEWPGEPEDVQQENPDELKEGKVPPMRIVFASFENASWYDKDDEKLERPKSWEEYSKDMSDEQKDAIRQDPLQHTLVAKVSAVTQWRNQRGKLFQFMRVMGDPEDHDHVAEANRRINDTTFGTLQSLCAPITMRHALSHYTLLSSLLKEAIEKLVGEDAEGEHLRASSLKPVSDTPHGEPWGIILDTAYIKAIEAGKTVNDAISKASAAVKERQTQILNAQAKAEEIRLEGVALAQKELAESFAEAEGISMVAEAMKKDGALEARQLDVLQKGMENANLVMAGEAIGLVAAAKELLKK